MVTGGFIGQPTAVGFALGVFDGTGAPQGIYAGRGGAGQTAVAANGAVTNIVARQIAAIGAAYDASTETFAIARLVANVKADYLGYDANRDGEFDTTGGAGSSPATARPIDGFILAQAIQGLNVGKVLTGARFEVA